MAVVTWRHGEITPPARRRACGPAAGTTRLKLAILGELQALDRRLALLGNVADDMRNRIGLVLEVTVGDILEARSRQTLAGKLKILDESALGFYEGLKLAPRSKSVGMRGILNVGLTIRATCEHLFLLGEASLDLGDQLVWSGECLH